MSTDAPTGGEAAAPDIRVRRGAPTDDELAALIAVVGGAYLAEDIHPAETAAPRRSRWAMTARGVRRPLDRERGWGGFTG